MDHQQPAQDVSRSTPSALTMSTQRIPNEILLNIAEIVASTDGPSRQATLWALSCANKCLRSVAHPALYQRPSTRLNDVPRLVSSLLSYTDLANKITEIEVLRNLSGSTTNVASDIAWSDVAAVTMPLCPSAGSLHALGSWKVDLENGDPYAFLAVLLLMLPALKSVNFDNEIFERMYRKTASLIADYYDRPYMVDVVRDLCQQLDEFTVHADPLFRPILDPWNLIYLKMLSTSPIKHLSVPMHALVVTYGGHLTEWPPAFECPLLIDVLPSQLETLIISQCYWQTASYLRHVPRHVKAFKGSLVSLAYIKAQWEHPLLYVDGAKDGFLRNARKACEAEGIKVEFEFQDLSESYLAIEDDRAVGEDGKIDIDRLRALEAKIRV